ncbi:glycosyl hydrolase family 18 protein [Paludicola sp. MB14-C6]|uniref:glycosyl hydrolase family 18 protein n=1 Tax=Paludihabitans sp. MB14-C6 TaxID=3070656 RepID=UPI0027DB2B42|nr:glycosyl hydrolase family 18 protein [Paludicola sp. MB14-C6]WMJ22758.1 glycosyl hydrolase family 18 protein [Paludicola sp. MB14-C6]
MKVIGYYAAWEPTKMNRIRLDTVTHVNYSFAIPTEDADLLPLDHGEDARKLIQICHENNIKVSISLGGWSWKDIPLEPTFIKATATQEKIEKLTDRMLEMIEDYGFDGVDMDWEHPRVSDGTYKQYEKLMITLGNKLHAKGLTLTTAVIGGVDANGNPGGIDTGGADVGNAVEAQTDKVLDMVDWINVMAYDGPATHHASFEYAVGSLNYWKNVRGLDSKKITIGVPFYGRGTAWVNYEDIVKQRPEDGHLMDECEINGGVAQYNGIPTILKKLQLAKDENLGGIMIWELSEDTLDDEKSLQIAIRDHL